MTSLRMRVVEAVAEELEADCNADAALEAMLDCLAENLDDRDRLAAFRVAGGPMTTRYYPTCSVEDCDSPSRSRGWCPKHYTRWKRHGDPMVVKKPRIKVRPPLERLLSHIDASGDCWEWTGTKSAQGYGTVGPGYPSRNAHRALWILLVGPVPDGWHVDHLCRNTSCVNPDHMEPVTHQENIQRGMRRVRRCTICYLPTHAKGYCESHYRKHLRGTL